MPEIQAEPAVEHLRNIEFLCQTVLTEIESNRVYDATTPQALVDILTPIRDRARAARDQIESYGHAVAAYYVGKKLHGPDDPGSFERRRIMTDRLWTVVGPQVRKW